VKVNIQLSHLTNFSTIKNIYEKIYNANQKTILLVLPFIKWCGLQENVGKYGRAGQTTVENMA
jgi:hypothetical protein